MPNYEPTPRRFSVLSVSRSASRRNSFDDAARQNLTHDTPGLQQDSPPLDLASALRHLQHVDPDSEMERGRKRQAGGDNAARRTWGHDGMVTAPSARRESSASTRERIALWEERSRSQSKGRSKSRGRDLGSRSRISVVPEIPELSAAFVKFAEEEKGESGADQETRVASRAREMQHLEGGNPEHITQTGKPTGDMAGMRPEAVTQADGTDKLREIVNIPRGMNEVDTIRRTTVSPSMATPTNTKDFDHERPQTPVCQTGQRPFTPETTPSTRLPGSEPSEPQSVDLPLTPQATPDQGRHRRHEQEEDIPHSLREQHFGSNPVKEYTAVFQPKADGHHPLEDGGINTQPPAQYHLPFGLLSEESPWQERQRSAGPRPSSPQRLSGKHRNQTSPEQHGEPRYHNVWRISSYQPEFPLPERWPDYANVAASGNTGFVGNPLRELPAGQLPSEPRNHRGVNSSAYPYARRRDSSGGDWVVNIPPSPSTAYFPGEQTSRAPRAGNGSGARTERYMSRSDASRHEWDAPPVIERALHAASVSMIQGLNVPVEVYRGLRDTYYPAPGRPDIIKAYPARRRLPIR